jgi:hypothetical protein
VPNEKEINMTEQNDATTALEASKRAFAPNGKEIVGTLDTLTGRALASGFTRAADGSIQVGYIGETIVHWDEQRPMQRNGLDVYLDDDGYDWTADQIHLEGEKPRAIPSVAPAPALKKPEDVWTPASGYHTAGGKSKWRCWNESKAAGQKEYLKSNGTVWLCDTMKQAQRKCVVLNAKTERVIGAGAPAISPAAPSRDALALGFLKARNPHRTDIETMFAKAQLPDAGNTVGGTGIRLVVDALRDADVALALMSAAAPAPAMVTVWTCTTEGDNCPLTTTAHASQAEAFERVRDDLRADCPGHQVASLNGMSASDMPDEWERKYDGACIIESHEVLVTPSAAPYATEAAKLTAAAPALLKALQDMRGEIDAIQGYWTEGLDNFAMQADQAIEMATGGTKLGGSPASA